MRPTPLYADVGSYPYGTAEYEASQQQQAYANSFVTLPPLPGRGDQAPLRSASHPRVPAAHYVEQSNGQLTYPQAARNFPSAAYPATYGEEPDRASWMQGGFQPKLSGFASEAEQRRRTNSAGGVLGAQGSHESFVGIGPHRSNGFVSSPQEVGPTINTTGRTTPVGGMSSGPKSRFTLDDHMSHWSPKAAAGTPASSTTSSASKPPPAMAIPAIPPFDRNRHEKHLLAQAQTKSGPAGSGANSMSATTPSADAQSAPLPTHQMASYVPSQPLSTASAAGMSRAG